MKRLLSLIILPMLLLLLSIATKAQDLKTITGKITDTTGKALAGATISVKGTRTAVQSVADGSFVIKVPSTITSLSITSVGFAAQDVAITGSSVDVVLVNTNTALNDVVVVAYGTRRRGDLTGAVTSISSKDFQKGTIPSSEQLLQGKVAGLQVTTGGGSAGTGSRIRVRGGASLNATNEPLIVIDGVPVESNGLSGSANYLNTINPNDIESMSVLKDASATALYGSRASNGVIIITTKKGVKGQLKFNFNTQESISTLVKEVPVLTGDEVRSIVNADATATGVNTWKNRLGTASTDWQKQIYRDAFATDNNLSVSGAILGSLPFRASVGYLNQDGILKTNNFSRVASSLNLSPKFFNNHLAVNINTKYAHTTNRFADEGAVGSAISFDPTQPILSTTKYGAYTEILQADGNPLDLATRNPLALLEYRDNTSAVNRFIGNIQLDYKLHFFPDLHVLVNLGMDNAAGSGNDNIDSTSATNYKTAGRKSYYKQGKQNYLADVQLFYAKEIKSLRSKVDVLVGHSYQDFITNVHNYASYSFYKDSLIPTSVPTFATDKPEYRIESYLGRINLTIADNYLITGSFRRDAVSRFSPETRNAWFPAVAAAWKLKETFLQNARVLSELKLRVGYGVTGQQDIGSNYYNYLARYGRSTNTAQYQFGDTYYSFLRPSAYDRNIKWETTNTLNLGLDFGFLQNRIGGSVEVYEKKTRDLLSTVPVAPGSNFDITLLTNVGSLTNRGVEVTLNLAPIRKRDMTWDINLNGTYNKTRITKLLNQSDASFTGIAVGGVTGGTGNNIGKFTVGYAPYTFFAYKQIYDKSGSPIEGLYEDVNRDGQVNDADRYYYKKPAPDFLMGASSQFTYKKYSIGFASHGSFGNYLYNNLYSNTGVSNSIKNPQGFVANASRNYLDTRFTNNRYLSDYYISNASFFRLDNINIGYNVGRVYKNANLRLSATVQNVFIITKYKGLDPEVSSDAGIDYTIYPRPRVYSLSANIDF